ncbi:MAG: sugar phosphate isomerase/epimerase [Bacteroidia bacterium]|nr:sugar phosphate isomerase/epimerase [Bacteroidia bacterium]
MKFTRRNFIKTTGTGIAAAGIPAFGNSMNATPSSVASHSFRLAVAGYTFAKIDLDQSLVMMKRVGMNLIGVKDFHLPLTSSQEVIDQTLAKMKSFGVEPYGVGPIYMKSDEAVEQAFTYAKKVGVRLLVGVPDAQFLPYVEKKVKETGIRVAIHNHGPDMPLYPSAGDIWAEIKNLDSRIGFCLDIGHTVRLGLDPIEAFNRYQERIFDFHIWDTDKAEKAGGCVEAGRGIIDFPKFFKTIMKAKYAGTVSLEYTKDMSDPLPGVAESIGYFRGVLAELG